MHSWTSTTEHPVGQQLLIAGKQLMKAVYNYNDKQPDYLPESYQINDQTKNLTDYFHHIENSNTSMYWKNATDGKDYAWLCNTDQILESDFSNTNPSTSGYLCLTDCSGLATGLLAYCNSVGNVATKFSAWKKGEAVPNASQYLASFNDKTNNDFTLVSTISTIEPGNYIAFSYHRAKHENTGHIMLIVATRLVNDYQMEVVVLDESSSAHTNDTRFIKKDGKRVILPNGKHAKDRGIGMGKALIGLVIKDQTGKAVPFTGAVGQDKKDAFLAFYWGDGINHSLEYPIAIGQGEI